MADKVKVVTIVKNGKKSFDVTCNHTQWTNIDNYQVVGRVADIVESQLKKNKTDIGKYNIIIIRE